jgi:hypothetical protein
MGILNYHIKNFGLSTYLSISSLMRPTSSSTQSTRATTPNPPQVKKYPTNVEVFVPRYILWMPSQPRKNDSRKAPTGVGLPNNMAFEEASGFANEAKERSAPLENKLPVTSVDCSNKASTDASLSLYCSVPANVERLTSPNTKERRNIFFIDAVNKFCQPQIYRTELKLQIFNQLRYFATNGILRPLPNALGETLRIGAN